MNVKTVLAIQDTTILNYTSAEKIKGPGFTDGTDTKKGFLVHSVMTLDGDTGKPLGILDQQVIVRKKIHDKDETYEERIKRDRESDKWFIGLQKTHELLNGHKKVIHVADRESDIYFWIKDILALGDSFVIRACRNRSTSEGYLMDVLCDAEYKGSMHIEIPHKGGRKKKNSKGYDIWQNHRYIASKSHKP